MRENFELDPECYQSLKKKHQKMARVGWVKSKMERKKNLPQNAGSLGCDFVKGNAKCSAMPGPGSYTIRKYVTDELLAKLNTLLEIMRKFQPPADPTVSAIKEEIKSLNDKQQLYDMYQGKMNPFKTSEAVDSITQTTTPSDKSDSEMMAEMLRLKGMFQQRCRRKPKQQRVISS